MYGYLFGEITVLQHKKCKEKGIYPEKLPKLKINFWKISTVGRYIKEYVEISGWLCLCEFSHIFEEGPLVWLHNQNNKTRFLCGLCGKAKHSLEPYRKKGELIVQMRIESIDHKQDRHFNCYPQPFCVIF